MEAEGLVSQLSLDPEKDSEVEISLKLAIVDMYTRRLRERARRKRIARDYQLVEKYFANIKKDPTKPSVSKEHKYVAKRKIICFSSFMGLFLIIPVNIINCYFVYYE